MTAIHNTRLSIKYPCGKTVEIWVRYNKSGWAWTIHWIDDGIENYGRGRHTNENDMMQTMFKEMVQEAQAERAASKSQRPLITLPAELPRDVVMELGTYLCASKLSTYENEVHVRLTDSEDGSYIVCGMYKLDYDKDPASFDSMTATEFKTYCEFNDAETAIIIAGDFPKFDQRVMCGDGPLTFEEWHYVMELLSPYIQKVPN